MKLPLGPVEAFFSGISSLFGRTLAAFAAIFVGFVIDALMSGFTNELEDILGFPVIGMLFWWGGYGGWFFVGMLSFGAMFGFLIAFVREWRPKVSFFAVVTTSVIYHSPFAFKGYELLWASGIYAAVCLCYWIVPFFLARWLRKKVQEDARTKVE